MKKVLLVCHDSDFSRAIRMSLSQMLSELPEGNRITPVDNYEEARAHLGEDWDVVVTQLHIPKSLSEPVNQEEQWGLELLKRIDEQGRPIASLLIAPRTAWSAISRITGIIGVLYRCALVFEGPSFGSDLVDRIKEYFASPEAAEKFTQRRRKTLEIDIDLFANAHARAYRINGIGFGYRADGFLQIDDDTLEDLCEVSHVVGEADTWQSMLRVVGNQLKKQLFLQEKNGQFRSDVAIGLERAGGRLDATHVRFNVVREFYPVAVEAILYPESDDFWMLQAPIYRRLAGQRGVGTLFERRARCNGQPLNCLIIEANAEGEVDELQDRKGDVLYLEHLNSVTDECEDLKALLEQNRKELCIDRIELLRQEDCDEPFSDCIRKVIAEREWHIVHYGGHSHYDNRDDSRDGVGYVFFQNGDTIQKVTLTEFSNWLFKTSFVYLSSCESSNADFVFQMARNRIPAVVGFRWDIEDHLAAEHSRRFYEHLISNRCLAQAFLKARQDMHRDYESQRIWAAPMLVKQV